MKRLNIYGAFLSLAGPGTKEDIIIQVAKQQNIRFNDLPQLQKEVDRALEESLRLGFVDRQGPMYKLSTDTPTPSIPNNVPSNKLASGKTNNETPTRSPMESKAQGQGDGMRSRSLVEAGSRVKSRTSSCSACSALENTGSPERRKNSHFLDKHLLRKDKSICSICGLNSDKRNNIEGQDVDKASWPDLNPML
ncbi:uncharacterized protein [Drosophila virilis]|uniref:Uncharacterized protein n=1 Tax=Drosophila virilis TaxID=7244 RepID=B4LKH0_DROVI|nr:uncharacterized protein LOC6625118 [Drosophila virilis]EDW60691.1 uncharacterized protein Dvir_GJ20715 [Drosophila virilis]